MDVTQNGAYMLGTGAVVHIFPETFIQVLADALIRYPLVVRSESISTEPLVPEILR